MANVGRDHSPAELKEFEKKKNIQSPLASDPERKVYHKFAESYSPRGVVIGPDGVVIEHVIWHDPERMAKTVGTIEKELSKLKSSQAQ
jgi:peroxiredoxin